MAKKKTAPDLVETEAAPAPASEYTVLARRYRPGQFADLVGQETIAQSLKNAIQSRRVAHAYLFTGARGVGKTSTARILAKALNCEKGPTITPCDQCDLCRAIATGEDMDVLEIDGASNRGIDEVRDIRQNVGFRPSRARYKIYIIDEVHMLTGPAFNALLKTLEEPPPHVKFIFATTEAQKIPVTILSRCQRFDFAGIHLASIVERLQAIVQAEGMQADPDALELIARRAGGSMRDGQSLLDQLLAFGGKTLTIELVHRLLGTANDDRIGLLAQAIFTRDASACLDQVRQMADQGLNLGELLDQLIDYWRDLMIVHSAGPAGQGLSVTGPHREKLLEFAKGISLDLILAGLDVLVTAKNRLRYTPHQRVVLEMTLVRLCRLEDLIPVGQLVNLLTGGGAAGSSPPQTGTGQARSGATSPSVMSSEKKKPTLDETSHSGVQVQPLTETTKNEIWQQVISRVGFTIGNELRKASSLAISGPNALVILFPASYNFGERFLDATRVARVEEALAQITGQSWTLRLENQKASGNEPQVAPPEAAEPASLKLRRTKNELGQLALVAKAQEALGAQIMQVEEGFGAMMPAEPLVPKGSVPEED